MVLDNNNRQAIKDRARQALELRKAGASYDVIAQRLGYKSRQAAHYAVTTLLNRTAQDTADELRPLELARLDEAMLAIYAQVRNGNHGAIDRLLKIMERRAKLTGLDAPTQTEHTHQMKVYERSNDFDPDSA